MTSRPVAPVIPAAIPGRRRQGGSAQAGQCRWPARGTPVLSGPEALDHSPRNSFELRWAGSGHLDVLSMHPPDIRHPLTQLLHSPSR